MWSSSEGHREGTEGLQGWEVGLAHLAVVGRWIQWVILVWLAIMPQKHANAFLVSFFSDSIAPLFLSVPPPPSLPLSLLVAINYTDSLTGWNKEIKHLNIVSWCMHSSPLPNTDIEEILHSSCQLTKLYPSSRATPAQVSSAVQRRSFQNMQELHSFGRNLSCIFFFFFNTIFSEAMDWISV